MEPSETRDIIRDWDPTLQPRATPRYKTWLPLATQQLRLRSLMRIIGHNLDDNEKKETRWFYYTIHRTSMSSPLYTSEAIDSTSPRWASLEVPTLYSTDHSTASEIVVRLWKRTVANDPSSDTTAFTWSLSLTSLVYLGPKLPQNIEASVTDNAVIFQFHGGYFVPADNFRCKPNLNKYLYMSISTSEVKDSYNVEKLRNLRGMMQKLKKQSDSVNNLRDRIASGVVTPKYPQTALNRLLQPRRLSKEKRAQILQVRKELEDVKFRTKLLEHERVRKMGEIRALNQKHSDIVEDNQDQGSDLMSRYRELNKDIERLCEWRQGHLEKRDDFIQLTGHLVQRQRQLISEMNLIHRIEQEADGRYKIHDVHLPDSESLGTAIDPSVAVALGFVAQTTQMIAHFLNVPLRYRIIFYGSKSRIVDHISENIPNHDRQFPLYVKGKDLLRFRYALYLLNKNIAQLKWYCGLPTTDLRATLPNLANLIAAKPNQPLDQSKRTYSGSSLDTEATKKEMPLIQKLLFERGHRPSRSTSQLKNSKLFGSSLDQGLDKPIPNLDSHSKRICKSEESAIDDTAALNLARGGSSLSSHDDVFQRDCKSKNLAHIEILHPTSVSEQAAMTPIVPSTRLQTSSNSISSCEMALSSPHDGDDSSYGTSSVKGMNRDDSLEQVKSCETDPLLDKELEERQNANCKEEDEEQVDEKKPLLDEFMNESRESDEPAEMRLTSSYSGQSTLSRMEKSARRRCESESREESTKTDSSIWSVSEFDQVWKNQIKQSSSISVTTVGDYSSGTQPSLFANDDSQENAKNFPTKYIDSIRKSTENVYARTEALASKKTSFKVMRPRT